MRLSSISSGVLALATCARGSKAGDSSKPGTHHRFADVTTSRFSASCAALAKLIAIDNVVVNFAEHVAPGTNITFPNADPTCRRPFQVVTTDLCRVNMDVATSDKSGLVVETWLPKNWTGRFLSTGNGGLGGCIQFEDLDYTASLGFAAVGTNNGHDGQSGATFLDNDEVVADFAFRGVKTGAVVGKSVAKLFYRSKHTKSYYLGCSSGGRQGFKAVQDFPDEFDGLVIGAPALGFNTMAGWTGNFITITGTSTSETFLPMDLWAVVNAEVMNQCDEIDGVKDGIIEDPNLCKFNATAMLCAPGKSTGCLTKAQVTTVNRVFSDLIGEDGSSIYPRMQPGSEILASQVYYNGVASPFTDWLKFAVFADRNWDPTTLTLQNITFAREKNPSDAETFDTDLSAFRSSGGKILHYHGLQDGIITSEISEKYYEAVRKAMGLSFRDMDKFYRYFKVSGMDHCALGPGAWQIGQTAVGTAKFTSQDNILMRMVDWVEKGKAPETIRGTKFINDDPSLGLDLVRNHCKYPKRTVFKGKGNPDDENSWECK
ncbi:Tannase/feruloyl esterase [Ilyonectria destructans]|nr:Tannase/feruloyl esterase [Ilyonectria destructans]